MSASTKAAIATDSPHTAAAGARIAKLGGNAVDIAVAAALTATVTEPLMCSLGGSAFFMVRPAGSDAQLFEGADATPTINELPRESPAWRTAHLPYGDGIDVQVGHASIAVPGMLAATEAAWKRHGRLPWRDLVAPALELSRGEIPVTATLSKWLAMVGRVLFWEQDACRRCFFSSGETPVTESETIRVPNLDHTYEAIAEQGARTLYDGDLAEAFASGIQENGGFVTREDLAAYQAAMREPIALHSRGFQLALNPPPAVGGAAVGCLIDMLQSNWHDSMSAAERALLHANSQARLLGIRDKQLADPSFDDRAAHELLQTVSLPWNSRALKSPNTTHLSVVTSDGGMAAVTLSMGYGAGVIIPSLGIGCNNSLGEPELNPRGFHVAPPGTRLISNMAPTLAWHEDGRCLAIGSPGASRITTSIAQTWARFALEGKTFEEAVEAPRLHIESYHDGLRAQFEPGIDASLLSDEYIRRPVDSPRMYFGAIKLAAIDGQGQFHAVADERRNGGVEESWKIEQNDINARRSPVVPTMPSIDPPGVVV